jgi:hypothetical protein
MIGNVDLPPLPRRKEVDMWQPPAGVDTIGSGLQANSRVATCQPACNLVYVRESPIIDRPSCPIGLNLALGTHHP